VGKCAPLGAAGTAEIDAAHVHSLPHRRQGGTAYVFDSFILSYSGHSTHSTP
jgi:hypothetical protein